MMNYSRFKFRAFVKNTGLLLGVDSFFIDPSMDKITLHFSDNHTKTMKPSDFVLEQCTGLKDKNGNLIYEGDIIQTDYNGVELDKYIYRWESPAFYVEPIEKGKPTGSHYYHYAVCPERSTVIGNIHQNQKLLKDGK